MSTGLTLLVIGVCVGLAVWLSRAGTDERLRALVPRLRSGPVDGLPGPEDGGESVGGVEGANGPVGAPGGVGSADKDALAFDLDLTAICLRTGLPTERAMALAASTTGDRCGLGRLGRSVALGGRETPTGPLANALAEIEQLVLFSRSTGVALAPLLEGMADDLRRSEHRRRQVAAARLGVRLVLPLGVNILPAFVLMGVLPVVITLVTDMSSLFTGGAG
ncbi:type II secretion system F family protein [Brevibacterium litoralis]|uniref:type II secretion system F family protein n=1 Tax=Brevibacterium litoralis TaxID=3138935 RepID=UPI0032EB24B8